MAWETTLFEKAGLKVHHNCLELALSYASDAPLWERLSLAAYVGLGTRIAKLFRVDTHAILSRADSIIADLLAASHLSTREIAMLLRRYVRLRLEKEDHLPFEEAREKIYNQKFYPVVTHFTFAFQPSASARLKFIKESVAAIGAERATVADLGCGSGVILSEVLSMKASWTGHGLDISPAAIAYAQNLAAHKGVSGRAKFRVGNINDLPYEDQSLNLVIASEVVEHMPEPERVIEEIRRVLKPGGQLILTLPLESHTPAHIHTLGKAEDLRALCEKMGFKMRRLESHWHFGYGDDRRHIFALAEACAEEEVQEKVYSFMLPDAA